MLIMISKKGGLCQKGSMSSSMESTHDYQKMFWIFYRLSCAVIEYTIYSNTLNFFFINAVGGSVNRPPRLLGNCRRKESHFHKIPDPVWQLIRPLKKLCFDIDLLCEQWNWYEYDFFFLYFSVFSNIKLNFHANLCAYD